MMGRTALAGRHGRISMRALEYAALHGRFADTFDDRVSDSLVDYDDEHEVLDLLLAADHAGQWSDPGLNS